MSSFLYVADSVQRLADGKFIAVGLYLDRTIVLSAEDPAAVAPTKEKPYGMQTLAVVFVVREQKPGPTTLRVAMKMPSGEAYPSDFDEKQIVVGASGTYNITFNFAPFAVPEFGTYRIELDIGGRRLEESFDLRLASPPEAEEFRRRASSAP